MLNESDTKKPTMKEKIFATMREYIVATITIGVLVGVLIMCILGQMGLLDSPNKPDSDTVQAKEQSIQLESERFQIDNKMTVDGDSDFSTFKNFVYRIYDKKTERSYLVVGNYYNDGDMVVIPLDEGE